MAHDEEPVLTNPPTREMAHHVSDYSNFIRLFKYGAVACFIIAMGWMMIVKFYW